MKERIKSFLIMLLMMSALFLIFKIWSFPVGVSIKAESSQEALEGASYLLEDMILPEKNLISFNENYKTILYNESNYGLYRAAKDPLVKVFSASDIKAEDEKENSDRFIIFQFSNPINSFLLSKSLGVGRTNSVSKEIDEIENIIIKFCKDFNSLELVNDYKTLSVKLPKEEFLDLEEMIGRIEDSDDYDYYYSVRTSFGVDNDLYFPYEITRNIPDLYVDNRLNWMNSSDKRNIARRFLGSYLTGVQEIEEEMGSTVFIADGDILKIEDSGIIEYQSILDRDINNRNLIESTQTAIKYISEKIPDKKGIYLNRIREIESGNSKGYRFIFEYRILGYPVFYRSGNYLEMDIFNDKLKYMRLVERRESKRAYDLPEPGYMIKSSFDILEKEYELFKKFYMEDNKIPVKEIENIERDDVISWIKDSRLSFFDNSLKSVESQLIPAWIFETDSWLFGFDALTGNLIYQEGI